MVSQIRPRPDRLAKPTSALKEAWSARVDSSGGPTACWPWLGTILNTGYGQLWADGIRHSAHRVAYVLNIGQIPDGLVVMHSCDFRACNNPAHLSVGSTHDNLLDMVSKGRQRKGLSLIHI